MAGAAIVQLGWMSGCLRSHHVLDFNLIDVCRLDGAPSQGNGLTTRQFPAATVSRRPRLAPR